MFHLFLLVLATPAMADEPFRICAEPDNLPLATESRSRGAEIDVARLLASDMGRSLEVVWIAQRDYAYFRQTVGRGACDAIMSVPAGFGRLTTTVAWYRTGFVALSRADSESAFTSFDDPRLQQMSIGIPVTGLGDGTPPAIALARRGLVENVRPFSVYDPEATAIALAHGEIDAAVLWGPFAGWYAEKESPALTLHYLPAHDGPIPLVFDIAIGVKKGNEALRDRLNQAIGRHQAEIDTILRTWRIPHSRTW